MENDNYKCMVCNKEFKTGEYIQAFLRSPDDEAGSFTAPVAVANGLKERIKRNKDKIKRKHLDCSYKHLPVEKQTPQIAPNCQLCKTEMGFDFSNNIWCKSQSCLLFNQLYDASTYPNQILVNQVQEIRKRMFAEFVNESAQANKDI